MGQREGYCSVMCWNMLDGFFRIEGSAGLLTNFETMALLKSRGADRGIGVAGGLTAAEIKVYNSLCFRETQHAHNSPIISA